MKNHLPKIFSLLLVSLITLSFGPFVTYAEQTTAQDKAMDIIENVLSVDLSKYAINLKHDSTHDGVPISNDSRKITTLQYTLSSENNTVNINFIVEKDIVTYCYFSPLNDVIRIEQYNSRLDGVKSFLEKYQAHTMIDSTNLADMLDNVDITKESTTIVGNTKLVIDGSLFQWIHTVNGADYTSLRVSFYQSGAVASFMDNRGLYTIGDTSITISKEQAIDIALNNLTSYSYRMHDGSVVKDFNVTKANIVAELGTSPVNYELRPCWGIKMPLDQRYPGSVVGINAFIWANNVETVKYSNIAFGGVDYDDNSQTTETTPLPEEELPNNNFVLGVALIAVAFVVVSIAVLAIKEKK